MLNAPVTPRRYALLVRHTRAQHPFRRADEHGASDPMKRLVDMLIASFLLAITAPLLLLVALAISLESPGPILVKETCIGVGGHRFQMLRFRTFLHDPDQMKPIWARKPTPVGEALRFTRIEALPQLFNLLRGEISIIDRDGRSPSFLD